MAPGRSCGTCDREGCARVDRGGRQSRSDDRRDHAHLLRTDRQLDRHDRFARDLCRCPRSRQAASVDVARDPIAVGLLLLSYRRSFWIAAVLAVLLVLLLGISPLGRRMLVPVGLLVALAIWLLGSTSFQSQSPIVKRVTSLQSSKVEANVEDRYRIDERANVLSEIDRHPISWAGHDDPMGSHRQALPVEHEGGRLYVHFAALWFWLKLGVLGLLAYIADHRGRALVLAFRAWRAAHDPISRAFGLASLCGVVALVVLDTTASFTGVDARFTVLFGAQLGLLACDCGWTAIACRAIPLAPRPNSAPRPACARHGRSPGPRRATPARAPVANACGPSATRQSTPSCTSRPATARGVATTGRP